MKPLRLPPARLGLADIAILCLLGGVIAVVVSFAREFEAPFSQAVRIDLSPAALPWYTLYSLSRGVLALLISYLFALGFGWAAAKSPAAERFLLPLLDILQSIPVLGFLPGLVLGLMSLFPTRNVGLELAAILMIFTAQAWNLALSFYNSLKALPQPLRDACKVAGWPPGRTFRQLEVPAAAQGLVWNGMLSMAGGWFFLMVNEAFRLGDHDYRLPGIGSYMSVALDQGNAQAMALAIAAMVAMIVCVDQLLWRPLVVWVEKFRLDESSGGGPAPSSWVLDFLRRARLPRRAAVLQRRAYRRARRAARPFERPFRAVGPVILRGPRLAFEHRVARKIGAGLAIAAVAAAAALGAWRLWLLVAQLGWAEWGQLVSSAVLTFARVMGAVIVSTAWALPAGVVIGRSPRLARALQPVIQVVASFPAPMLFPLVILLFQRIGIGLGDRKSTRLNSSHEWISYAVFCLKKKKCARPARRARRPPASHACPPPRAPAALPRSSCRSTTRCPAPPRPGKSGTPPSASTHAD